MARSAWPARLRVLPCTRRQDRLPARLLGQALISQAARPARRVRVAACSVSRSADRLSHCFSVFRYFAILQKVLAPGRRMPFKPLKRRELITLLGCAAGAPALMPWAAAQQERVRRVG